MRRRVTAWAAMLVLSLNVLAPMLFNGPASAAPDLTSSLASDPLSGQMVICTPSGMRVVSLDGENRPLTDPTNGDIQLCALCLPLVHGGVGVLAAGEVVLPLPAGASASLGRPAAARMASPASPHRLPEARAPPVLAA